MINDRHIRLREDGAEEHLPTVSTMCSASQDPAEDARLAAEHLEENLCVAKMPEEKGLASRATSLEASR
jgi:hypothetical protein